MEGHRIRKEAGEDRRGITRACAGAVVREEEEQKARLMQISFGCSRFAVTLGWDARGKDHNGRTAARLVQSPRLLAAGFAPLDRTVCAASFRKCYTPTDAPRPSTQPLIL
jgi:hypothetical protein